MRLIIATCVLVAVSANAYAHRPRIIQHNFSGFTVWVDCQQRGPIAFEYGVNTDIANNHPTTETWRLVDNVPDECEMTSGDTFTRPVGEPQYDRGHLVDANAMDNREQDITDTYYRINMAPQARFFNRDPGAWRHTERIVDCYRQISQLAVWGGIIYGDNDTSNDHFTGTHGVITAERWWKLIYRYDTNRYIAWIFDNVNSEDASVLPNRRATLDEIKAVAEFIPYFYAAENGDDSPGEWEVSGTTTLMCEGQTTSSS